MAEIMVVYRASDSEAANGLMEVARAKGITVWHWQYENLETSFDAFLDYLNRHPEIDTLMAVGGPGAMPLVSGAILPDYLKQQIQQPGNPVYYEAQWHGKRAVVMAGYDENETKAVVNAGLRAVVFALQLPDPGTAAAVYNNFNTIKTWEFLLPYTLDRAELSGNNVVFYCTLKESPMMVTGAAPYFLPALIPFLPLIQTIVAVVGIVIVSFVLKDIFTQTVAIADISSKNVQKYIDLYKNGDINKEEFIEFTRAEIKFREEAGEDTLKTLIKYLPIILGGMLAISLVSAIMPRR